MQAVHFSTASSRLRPWAWLPLLLLAIRLTAATTGPTLRLDYGQGEPRTNPVSQFMYFVPLISPEPVAVVTGEGNTQGARVLSLQSRTNGTSFTATCEFEFTGTGSLQNILDHSQLIQRRLEKLQAGEVLTRQLSTINVAGTGRGSVEITGEFTNGLRTVNVVKLRFNGHGKTSPVSISLQDIRYRDGAVQFENEIVARVNALVFQRQAGPPKMEVTLDSVKRKDAGNGAWQNFIGSLKGTVANLFIPPLTVAAEGQQAMLDFGAALAAQQPNFTFPRATRLKTK